MRCSIAPLVLALSLPAGAFADEIHEQQLDQQVQELRRQVDAQARRIDQLERSTRANDTPIPTGTEVAPTPADSRPWLVGSNWDRVHAGMTSEQVTAILGAPNSERPGDDSATLLLYALEVQEGVFLAGRVELRDGKVTAVQKPALR